MRGFGGLGLNLVGVVSDLQWLVVWLVVDRCGHVGSRLRWSWQ